MKGLVQRVSSARVTVDAHVVASIRCGLLVLVGVCKGDEEADSDYLAAKIVNLRVFPDDSAKMNRTVADAGGAVLSVPQFTLCADTRRGNRPGFDLSAPRDTAQRLWNNFNNSVRRSGLDVHEGVFGAHMIVELENDGPVTLMVDSKKDS